MNYDNEIENVPAIEELEDYGQFLENEGEQARLWSNITKLGSFITFGFGAVAASIVGPPSLIFFGGGGAVYALQLLQDAKRTKRLMLLPWVETDLATVAQNSDRRVRLSGLQASDEDLDGFHYLSKDRQIDYILLQICDDELAVYLDQAPTEKAKRKLWQQIRERFRRFYRKTARHFSNPLDMIGASANAKELAHYLAATGEAWAAIQAEEKAMAAKQRQQWHEQKEAQASPSEAPQVGQIGPGTQLNAVDVAARTVQGSAAPDPRPGLEMALANSPAGLQLPQPTATSTARDLVRANPFVSTAFFGGQRSGKSHFVAVLTGEFARQGITIFHINLASVINETGNEDDIYWQHVHPEHSVRCLKSALNDPLKRADVIRRANALVDCWADDSTGRAILVVDEWTQLTSKFNMVEGASELASSIADKASFYASAGYKSGKAVYTIAPNLVAGSLIDPGKIIKCLRPCLMAVHPDANVTWNGLAVPYDKGIAKQFERNYELSLPSISGNLSGCDRIAFLQGVWLPMGTNGTELKGRKSAPSIATEPSQTEAISATTFTPAPTLNAKAIRAAEQVGKVLNEWFEARGVSEIRAGDLTSSIRAFRTFCKGEDGGQDQARKELLLKLLRIAAERQIINRWESTCEMFGPPECELDIDLSDLSDF